MARPRTGSIKGLAAHYRRSAAAETPVQRVVAALQSAIRAGLLAPGRRLVEISLAADLGVKRGAVREALRILAGDGVVELLPRRGAQVRRLTAADALEMLPALGALLTASVQLALPHVREPAVRRGLEKAIRNLEQATRAHDEARSQRAATDYIEALLQSHGNRYVAYLYEKLHPDLFHRQLGQVLKVVEWEAHFASFHRMHDALMAGDPAAAQQALAEQYAGMRRALEENHEQPPRAARGERA